jgi:hypothetical protein
VRYFNITVARVQSIYVPNVRAETEEEAIDAAFAYINNGEANDPEYTKWAVEVDEIKLGNNK